jgi:hypothetical protein
MSDPLLFRGIPVFQSRSIIFDEERIKEQESSTIIPNQTMVDNIHQCYEEILILIQSMNGMKNEYVAWMDRLGQSHTKKLNSDCGKFLYYFYIHHNQLTEFDSWGGFDVSRLYIVFQVLCIHFRKLLALQTRKVEKISMKHQKLLESQYSH